MKISIKEERFGIPIERKRKHIVSKVLLIVGLIALIAILSIGIQLLIKCSINSLSVTNDSNATWLSSIASYWGGIIGGVISGTLTVIGVVWTIKYYRNSDVSKSRIEHMPFLMAEVKRLVDEKDANHSRIYKIHKSKQTATKVNASLYSIQLRNIGRGFASTLVVYTGENLGGIVFKELMQVNESKKIYLEINSDDISNGAVISFAIRYIDCMTNEYIQNYSLAFNDDLTIDNGYPTFICQTHTIGE